MCRPLQGGLLEGLRGTQAFKCGAVVVNCEKINLYPLSFVSVALCTSSLQKKAEAAHRILEGLGPQVELVSLAMLIKIG